MQGRGREETIRACKEREAEGGGREEGEEGGGRRKEGGRREEEGGQRYLVRLNNSIKWPLLSKEADEGGTKGGSKRADPTLDQDMGGPLALGELREGLGQDIAVALHHLKDK
jgi:hypothetical protein